MVLGGKKRVDVLELAAAVLQADGCLGGVCARLLLGQPAPQQAGDRADHGVCTLAAATHSRLPGQRRPLPGRYPSSATPSRCAASQRSPISGIMAPHSAHFAVGRSLKDPIARGLCMPHPTE